MKLQSKIFIILLIAFLGTAYFIWIAYQDHRNTASTQEYVAHTYDVIKQIDAIRTGLAETESDIRAFTITGDEKLLANLHVRIAELQDNLRAIQKMTADNPVQQSRTLQLKKNIDLQLRFYLQTINQRRSETETVENLIQRLSSEANSSKTNEVIAALTKEENTLLNTRIEHNKAGTKSGFRLLLWSSLLVLVFTILLLYRVNHDINMRKAAEQLAREKELKYRHLIDNCGVVIFTTNTQGEFTFVNQRGVELTGYAIEEMKGRHFSFLVDPMALQEVADVYQEQFVNKEPQTIIEFPIITKHGKQRWVEQMAVLLYDQGRLEGFHCIVMDITEQREAKLELQRIQAEKEAYQAQIQAILDYTPMMIYVKDLNGKYILTNKTFRDSFALQGRNPAELTVYDIASKDHGDRYTAADEKVRTTLQAEEVQDEVQLEDGPHYMLTVKFPVFDRSGELFGICGIGKDITEMEQGRKQLLAARQKAERAEKFQEDFLANMSHEIRTPLNGIVGMTGLLEKTGLSTQQREYVRLIHQSSDTLLVLINDLLDLSKIKAGKLSLEHIDFRLTDILDQVIQPFRLKTQELGISLHQKLSSHTPYQLIGDPHRLSQILNNLLSNAIKFTSKGYVELRVELDKPLQNDQIAYLAFEVIDTGIGIEESRLPSIFESFTQESAATTRQYGGTGLGLTITRQLVEMQGGEITVSSEKNKGTCFRFVLPFQLGYAITTGSTSDPTPSLNHQVVSLTPTREDSPASSLNDIRFDGQRVLVVEDNLINQKVIAYTMEQVGFSVSIANNGREAVDILKQDEGFDLIIMDIQMPEMDGYSATIHIRHHLGLDIPIVAMTASAMRQEEKKCREAGMNAYLTKPIDTPLLIRTLHKHLRVTGTKGTNSKEQPKLYDLDYLEEISGNNPLVMVELLQLFLDTAPSVLQEIELAISEEDHDMIRAKAHQLKSSTGLLKAESIHHPLERLEQLAIDGADLDRITNDLHLAIEGLRKLSPLLEMDKKRYQSKVVPKPV